jgi:hypothetical protein
MEVSADYSENHRKSMYTPCERSAVIDCSSRGTQGLSGGGAEEPFGTGL